MTDYRAGPTPTTYILGSRQTPTGAQTCVAMRMAAGLSPSSHVFLADGSFVSPDVNGQIIVPVTSVVALQSAGWLLVAASNTPSVTVP